MMKFCKERLEEYKDSLITQLTLNNDEIHTYTHLLKIISDSLVLRLFTDNIIEFKNYEHVMLIANYGPDYDDYIMTYIYDHQLSGTGDLNNILSICNKDDKIDKLMEICVTLLDNMITPYVTDIAVFKNKVKHLGG